MDLISLYTRLLEEADKALRANHSWLCARQRLIEDIIENRPTDRAQVQEVYDHLMAWGDEYAWFLEERGLIKLSETCWAVDREVEDARRTRERYFHVPFPARRLYFAARKRGARSKGRGSPPQGW